MVRKVGEAAKGAVMRAEMCTLHRELHAKKALFAY